MNGRLRRVVHRRRRADEFTAPQVGAAGTLKGLGGDDVLIAGDAHGDMLDGGAGDDPLEGGFGDDRSSAVPAATRSPATASRCNEYACDLLVSGNDTIEAATAKSTRSPAA